MVNVAFDETGIFPVSEYWILEQSLFYFWWDKRIDKIGLLIWLKLNNILLIVIWYLSSLFCTCRKINLWLSTASDNINNFANVTWQYRHVFIHFYSSPLIINLVIVAKIIFFEVQKISKPLIYWIVSLILGFVNFIQLIRLTNVFLRLIQDKISKTCIIEWVTKWLQRIKLILFKIISCCLLRLTTVPSPSSHSWVDPIN